MKINTMLTKTEDTVIAISAPFFVCFHLYIKAAGRTKHTLPIIFIISPT